GTTECQRRTESKHSEDEHLAETLICGEAPTVRRGDIRGSCSHGHRATVLGCLWAGGARRRNTSRTEGARPNQRTRAGDSAGSLGGRADQGPAACHSLHKAVYSRSISQGKSYEPSSLREGGSPLDA